MIDINTIANNNSYNLLKDYNGSNIYILDLKSQYIKNSYKNNLTENQLRYIKENHNKSPLLLNKIIAITDYLGTELQKKYNLSFKPEKIFVEKLLAQTEKAFHITGKLKQNQLNFDIYWLPKTQLIDDLFFDSPLNNNNNNNNDDNKKVVDIDFDKYERIDKLQRKLYNYQKEGVKFLTNIDRCILGDEMGSGKTLMAIISALEINAQKVLIVCPASVKINWEREINCFNTDTVIVNSKNWQSSRFTIINFDILKNFYTLKDKTKKVKAKSDDDNIDEEIEINNQLIDENFDLLIIDEAHRCSNNKSIRSKILTELSLKYNVKRLFLLSGTPITNRPMNFYTLLKMVKSPVADNWVFYAKRYCAGRQFDKILKSGIKKKIWLTNGASNLEELSQKVKNILLRRLKKDILDLPEKIIIPVYHKLSNEQTIEYDKLWDEYLQKRKDEGKPINLQKELVEIIMLRKYIALQAIPHTIELAEDAIEQGNKVVIFTNFTDELKMIQQHFGDSCVIHYGEMNDKQKQKSVDEFTNNPKITTFIGNMISAGVGINLTISSVSIINSFNYVPSDTEQALDRLHRIGAKNNITIYFNIFENTIDETIWKVLNKKTNIINTVLNDNNENIFVEKKDNNQLNLF